MEKGKIIVLLGMHRSGTSYVSKLLYEMGISMGDRLLSGDWSNPDGHYEDIDFLTFHKKILDRSNLSPYLTESFPLDIREEDVACANLLLQKKSQDKTSWGWKDPRTILFLPFWRSIIDNGIYIVVFRKPEDVVHSLLRRQKITRTKPIGRKGFLKNLLSFRSFSSILIQGNEFLSSWIFHYSFLLSNLEKDDPIFFLPIENAEEWADTILPQWLKEHNIEVSPRNSSEINKQKRGHNLPFTLSNKLLDQANRIYTELLERYQLQERLYGNR